MSKFLIAGLGNIGAEYQHTRHNIGFDVITAFVLKHKGAFTAQKLADVAEIKFKGKNFICIKPTTFMNLSGKAFKYWMDKEKVTLENTLTIVDDIALPIESLRLRPGGSDGGHNGLKDIQQVLNTVQYPKLRFGIGDNYPKGMQAEFVLSKWFPQELALVWKKIEYCTDVIENFSIIGIERTMNIVNNIKITIKE